MKPTTNALRTQLANVTRNPGIPSPLQARARAFDFHREIMAGSRPVNGDSQEHAAAGRNGCAKLNGSRPKFKIVLFGLSITSSWGNGHAATYRALVRELHARGHDVLFLERDAECYASNRDLPKPPFGKTVLYSDLKQLKDRYASAVRDADLVIVGSSLPEGVRVGEWVSRVARGATAFYDLDTPRTVANLSRGDLDYLSRALIPRYDMYLSFAGGPILHLLEDRYRARMARPLYCSVDTSLYYPEECRTRWDLGYIGPFSDDRQPALDELLLEPARYWGSGKFVVAGPGYPKSIRWPGNVRRFTHMPPAKHRAFYCAQKFTLNITRADMLEAGYSPSIRLFEAAACGAPIISDYWEGLDTFFKPNDEILIANSSEEALYYLLATSESERRALAQHARKRVLNSHTARHRAAELENYACEVLRPTISG